MFLHTVKWNYCLILFFFCYLILKIYLHKASLCNPLLLQMPLFFFVVIEINISCTFHYKDEYKKNTLYSDFFMMSV